MMRMIVVLSLALFIALSFGCSKKTEQAPANETTQTATPAADASERAGKVSPSYDLVSKEEIDVMSTPYSFELDGVIYYFASAENMEAFKADPQKYIGEKESGDK